MERLKTLRKVVWIAIILLFMQLAILVMMLYPMATLMWMSLLVVAILGLYLARISLALLAELAKKQADDK